MSIEILDKIKSINGFDMTTPKVVIIEIACCHGIEIKGINLIQSTSDDFLFFQKLKFEIDNMKKEEINTSFCDWSKLARFINPKCLWNRTSLNKAYTHFKIISNMNLEEFIQNNNFNFKNQTNDYPDSICTTLLYRFCKLANLSFSFNSSFEELREKFLLYISQEDYLLSLFKSKINKKLIKSQMINFLFDNNLMKAEKDETEISFDTLSEYYKIINDKNQLRLNLNPKVKSGAVALAALNYNLDISLSEDPILEYNYISTNNGKSFYDTELIKIHSRCEEHLNLRFTFNPIFPKDYYKCEQLAQYYGYSKIETQMSDPYELLKAAHVSETFYRGISPKNGENYTSIDLIPFSELEKNDTFSFGILGEKTYVFSKQELINHFNFHKRFLSPIDYNIMINKYSIRKLKNLLNKDDELRIILQYIETLSEIDDNVRNFIKKYNSDCYPVLKNFLHLSMYMRGWKGGKSAYPLTSKKTSVTVDKTLELELDVNNAFEKFYDSVEKCELGEAFLNLPLYKYCDQHFYKNENSEEGLTIGERLDIIKKGKETDNNNSCIRASSNILAQTIHKYFLLLKLPAPFEINKLKNIY